VKEKLPRILLFSNKNLKEGIEVQLVKIDSKVLVPPKPHIPMLDNAELEIHRACPDCGSRRGQTEKYFTKDGKDVTEQKQQVEWFTENAKGEKSRLSTTPSKVINVSMEIPFKDITKNIVIREGSTTCYLMKPWAGKKNDLKVEYRKAQLYDEAVRMAKENVAGVASFTHGLAFGKPTDPFLMVIYPIILPDHQVIWLVRPAVGTLKPEQPEFPYQDGILQEPTQRGIEAAALKEETPPELVDVKALM
jgi:hypothetical protein